LRYIRGTWLCLKRRDQRLDVRVDRDVAGEAGGVLARAAADAGADRRRAVRVVLFDEQAQVIAGGATLHGRVDVAVVAEVLHRDVDEDLIEGCPAVDVDAQVAVHDALVEARDQVVLIALAAQIDEVRGAGRDVAQDVDEGLVVARAAEVAAG